MEKDDVATVSVKIYALIKDLEPEMRKRAISAALTLVGDNDGFFTLTKKPKVDEESRGQDLAEVTSEYPQKVKIWMRNYSITKAQLDEVFHFENGEIAIIASDLPGSTDSKKTIAAYVLVGVATFIKSGETKFDDKSGRETCTKFGCYQPSNHTGILKNIGNELTGSKDAGWSLTGPGLKFGAELIKSIAAPKSV